MMITVKQTLADRERELHRIIKEKELALKHVPGGSLRYNRRETGFYYYLREDPKDPTGKYIKEKDRKLAAALAQRDYDGKVLELAKKELAAVQKLQRLYRDGCPEDLIEKTAEGRRVLISPIRLPDEEYARQWQEADYDVKPMTEDVPELETGKGEPVRSKTEVIIADTLARWKIPYRYESRLVLPGAGAIYPDFTVLNKRLRKELFWEHMGMMDDHAYCENAVSRIGKYTRAGILPGDKLILTFETRAQPLRVSQIETVIQKYLL